MYNKFCTWNTTTILQSALGQIIFEKKFKSDNSRILYIYFIIIILTNDN